MPDARGPGGARHAPAHRPADRTRPRRRHHVLVAIVVAGVLAASGSTALATALRAQAAPPPVPTGRAAGAVPAPDLISSPGAGNSERAATAVTHHAVPRPTHHASTPRKPAARAVRALAPAQPVSIDVPAIGVHSSLVHLGLNSDNTVQVPQDYRRAGWYDHSPTPGQVGPSVILGHIDSYKGPGVFYRLADLRPGNIITVHRKSGAPATFRVDAVREYPKAHFPSSRVYGPIGYAGLRLISCGGSFDNAIRSYNDNIVVYAQLAN